MNCLTNEFQDLSANLPEFMKTGSLGFLSYFIDYGTKKILKTSYTACMIPFQIRPVPIGKPFSSINSMILGSDFCLSSIEGPPYFWR